MCMCMCCVYVCMLYDVCMYVCMLNDYKVIQIILNELMNKRRSNL